MIKTQEFNGQQFIVQENHGVTPISEDVFLEIEKQNKQLQQYKSIVKKVDPDNLPEVEVLAFDNNHQLYTGYLYFHLNKVFCYNRNITANYELVNVTHYIEQKDLIKLFK